MRISLASRLQPVDGATGEGGGGGGVSAYLAYHGDLYKIY